MKPYLALIATDIRLALRQKTVIFFNYLMPFGFLFLFAQAFHAEQGGAILQVFTMVTVIGILGNGLFGAGMRAVQEREANILRRYKVAPITALPLLVAATVTGLVVYIPCVLAMLLVSKFRYGMQIPGNMASVLLFIVLGVVAIRSIGLIIASVVNSMQESTILVQIAYMTMLFLSGASFPVSMFPNWLLTVTQFIPATYLVSGMQAILIRHESLAANWQAVGALVLTAGIGLLLSVKLFRWEKEEKTRPSARLWVLAVLLPFVVLGTWQAYARDNVRKIKVLDREMLRSRTALIRNARIFVGNGKVIENGAVLIRGGKIAEVYDGDIPDPQTLKAEAIEAAGKTILPGLIDAHVHLGASGGMSDDWRDYDPLKSSERELAAYLYSGVTAVRSVGDLLDNALKTRNAVNSGEKLGAEFFTTGPLFTVPGGHGTEILKSLPSALRSQAEAQFLRLPKTAEEAKQEVDALSQVHVDAIKAILDAGAGGRIFNRLDPRILDAIAAAAHADGLPVVVHTGDVRDVEDALNAGVNGIEHGSFRQRIPDSDFALMVKNGVTYDPTLSVGEAFPEFAAGRLELLNRSLVQQTAPAKLLASTRRLMESPEMAAMRRSIGEYPIDMNIARDNLVRAWKAGVTLITGSDAGNMLVFHGPTTQHEMELWVAAGIPVQVALQAATLNSAGALRAGQRFGSIEKGKDATMLVVDGNPLVDIRATEAISFVMFKGERLNRAELLSQE
ncbi:MAG: amidohydrolase family protein [Bryobacteraceae bacterium]|jgi:imidazolonepropionase-like amidohydrolase/ABC-type multidrug transport system permease subunit